MRSFVRYGRGASLVGVAALLLASAPQAVAVASSRPYLLSGNVSSSSASAFSGRSGILTATGAQKLVSLVSPDYWIVSTAGPNGSTQIALEATANVPVALVEVADDPTAQQALVAVGAVAPSGIAWFQAQLAASLASSIAAQPDLAASRAAVAPFVVTPAGFIATHGYFSTFWTDPLGATLNSVIDEIHWSYNGSTVTALSGNDSRLWLSFNGWKEISHSIGSYYNSPHTAGTVWTNDNFRTSNWFPLPWCGTTNTYYQSNYAYGSNLGHIGGGVNTWATSGCRTLLSVTAFASPGS